MRPLHFEARAPDLLERDLDFLPHDFEAQDIMTMGTRQAIALQVVRAICGWATYGLSRWMHVPVAYILPSLHTVPHPSSKNAVNSRFWLTLR